MLKKGFSFLFDSIYIARHYAIENVHQNIKLKLILYTNSTNFKKYLRFEWKGK